MPADREFLIKERAYLIWEREGKPEGQSAIHWLRAESALHAEEATDLKKHNIAKRSRDKGKFVPPRGRRADKVVT